MRFTSTLAALPFVGAALAQTVWNVTVGANSTVTFTPDTIDGVVNGDIVSFQFVAGNHTATQSSFTDPCTPFTPPGQLHTLDSGFEPVAAGSANWPTYNFTVTNLTGPLWFHCAQTSPKDHCQLGMVFAINPTANKTFAAFQQAAMASANSTNGTSGSSSAYYPPSPSSSAYGSGSGSGSASAPAPTKTNAASSLRAGAAGMLLGGVGLLALAL